MNLVPLRYLSILPITNGLGLSGANDNREWPRYIRTTDIAGPTTLRDDVFASQPPDVAAAALVAPGDILMTAAGASIGKSVTFRETYPACYAGFLVRLRPKSEIEGRFLGYWMQSTHYWHQIRSGAVKSTIENFSAGRYRTVLAPQPELTRQREIVDYLDEQTTKIDALIAEQEGLVDVLRERRMAVIAHAVGRRPAGFNSTPAKRMLRRIRVSTGLIKGQASLEPVEGLVPAYSASGQDVWVAEQVAYASGPGVVLSAVGARCGKVFLADHPRWATVANTQAWGIAPGFDPAFVHYTLDNENFWVKGGSAQPYVQVPPSLEQSVFAPSLDQQRQIVARLDAQAAQIDMLIVEAEGVVEVARERRSALITAAVTGQMDVAGEVA